MSDAFYSITRLIGRHVFFVSSRPVVLNAEHVRRDGAFIIAANHTSPFDVPILIRHVRRHLDFVSTVEVFRQPFLGTFYRHLNAFPHDRSRPDAPTVRTILDRLSRGRVVAMFPEGGFRTGERSVVRSRQMRKGIGRIATLANVPIVPVVVIDSARYWRAKAWLPIRGTRYGVCFGPAIAPTAQADEIEGQLVEAFVRQHATLERALADIRR